MQTAIAKVRRMESGRARVTRTAGRLGRPAWPGLSVGGSEGAQQVGRTLGS